MTDWHSPNPHTWIRSTEPLPKLPLEFYVFVVWNALLVAILGEWIT